MGMGLCRRIWCMGMGMSELGLLCQCGVALKGEGAEEGVPSWLVGLFLLFLLFLLLLLLPLLVCCRRGQEVPVQQ